jgi:hypothetical protein
MEIISQTAAVSHPANSVIRLPSQRANNNKSKPAVWITMMTKGRDHRKLKDVPAGIFAMVLPTGVRNVRTSDNDVANNIKSESPFAAEHVWAHMW